MIEIIQSETFRKWLVKLRDRQAHAVIAARLFRLSQGLFGDTAVIDGDINELRIHFGPGYRIYYIRDGAALVVLLCGGGKGAQQRDIKAAQRLAGAWRRKS